MIDRERMQRAEELFRLGRQLGAEQRSAFVSRHVPDDADLRRELEALFAEDEAEEELLPGVTAVVAREGAPPTGERIGRYLLLEPIGEGGMGVVHLARQEEPVVREVALKLLHAGEANPTGIARFEAERQALALMDHPGIAQVFDGGRTASGRPYLVMELVRGEPLDDHCRRKGLSRVDRLRLFAAICDAVQHAHQKGVIHRDLKPSNVLVAEEHGHIRAKLIDFGIAGVVAGDVGSDHVGVGPSGAGSLAYMSPEQAAGAPADTRSDVFALGGVLHELLVDAPPVDVSTWRDLEPDEVRRRLAEPVHAPLPDSIPTELAAIVRRARAARPEERYGTAAALAHDVRAYLTKHPVAAVPATFGYSLRKAIERHRTATAALALAGLFGLVGVAGLAHAARESSRRETEAENARQVESGLRAAAETEGERRGRALDYALSVIEGGDLDLSAGPDLTVIALLRTAGSGLDDAFADDPEGERRFRSAIGNALLSLGDHEVAREELERLLLLQEADPRVPRTDVYATLIRLERIARDSDDQPYYDLSTRASEVAAELLLGIDPDLGADLQAFLRHFNDFEDGAAMAVFESIRAEAPARLPLDSDGWGLLADVFENLGSHLAVTEGRSEWTPMVEEALRIHDATGSAPGERARVGGHLAEALLLGGETARAAYHAEEVLEVLERELPEEHWRLSLMRARLGAARSVLGEPGAGDEIEAGREELIDERGALSRPAVEVTARWIEHLVRTGDPRVESARAELATALAAMPPAPSRWEIVALALPEGGAGLEPEMARLAWAVDRTPWEGGRLPDRERFRTDLARVTDALDVYPAESDLGRALSRLLASWAFSLDQVDPEISADLAAPALERLRPAPGALVEEVAALLEAEGRRALDRDDPEAARALAEEARALLGPAAEDDRASSLLVQMLLIESEARLGRSAWAIQELEGVLGRVEAVFGTRSTLAEDVRAQLEELRGAG